MSKKGKGNFIKFHGASAKSASATVSLSTSVKDAISSGTTTTASVTTISSETTIASVSTTQSVPCPTTAPVKRNPEALLDDLSSSLSSLSSTVKSWLPPSSLQPQHQQQVQVSWYQNGTTREPHLGLGAKPSTSPVPDTSSSGVLASLKLKSKLTEKGLAGVVKSKAKVYREEVIAAKGSVQRPHDRSQASKKSHKSNKM